MKTAGTLTAFAAALAAVFGAAFVVGDAVSPLTDPAPAVITPHATPAGSQPDAHPEMPTPGH